MKIVVTIQKPTKTTHYEEPEKHIFNGNYALEMMLIKISEKYFGSKVSAKIEDLLKSRINGGN